MVFVLAGLLALSACGGPGSSWGSDAETGAGSADEVAAWIAKLELTADADSSVARAVLRAYADFGNRFSCWSPTPIRVLLATPQMP
jgi:hypothetical protein